ncbi:MAG: hypothetical protein ACXAC8_08365 [Candidatus Hodarchaeales archaeon]|jgi:hypothetical protein
MSMEDKIKKAEKQEKKKKWEEASNTFVEIAENLLESKDYIHAINYLQRAIENQQKEKNAEKVIVLYRKIIKAAKRGRGKTTRELFRFAAAAIPITEEYIQVLKESGRYLTKHGALIQYFLGEAKEIVSGEQMRNEEFIRAGRVFVEVGKKLASSKKTETDAHEAFEKSRLIFNQIKNMEEYFSSLLVEAEIYTRKHDFERGFVLFDQARDLFNDDIHVTKVAELEKDLYAEIALYLLKTHFSDPEQRKISGLLISKSREAHLVTESLDKVSGILFETGKIKIEKGFLEEGFSDFDKAIDNSEVVREEATPRNIREYLFKEGKKDVNSLLRSSANIDLTNVDSLRAMKFFDKIEDLGKKLEMGHDIEEVALYLFQLGKDLIEKGLITEDSSFIEKSVQYLVRNNRINGLEKIGEELEKRLDTYANLGEMSKFERLKIFLVTSYREIDNNQGAGWLNVNVAQRYGQWGNHEEQLACLNQAAILFQDMESDLKAFSEKLNEQFMALNPVSVRDTIYTELLRLLGNTYLQLKNNDAYDSLYSQFALKAVEDGDFSKAIEYHENNFQFLIDTNNISRAIARVDELVETFKAKNEFSFIINLRSKQTNLLIETETSQELVLKSIGNLEKQLWDAVSQDQDISFIKQQFINITKLYDYLGLKEAHGDAAFEMASLLFEKNNFELGLEYLKQSYELFMSVPVIEKGELVLDFAIEKKKYYQQIEDSSTADRIFKFLINSLKSIGLFKEAAELIIDQTAIHITTDEKKAFDGFEEAKKLVSESESTQEIATIYHKFGSALLKAGNIDKGMEILTEAQSSTATNSLTIADTCLTIAHDKFTEKDYDIYFILVDRALSIYTELEMFQESSSIALAEARKLWSVNDLPYTMIFLERAWAPLSMIYDKKLKLSVQPLIQVTKQIVSALFNQQKYDEAKNFLEFQERIYRHLNLTEKILETERRKIDALIGKGNIEVALSQVLDMATIGIEESKFQDTIALLRDLLPIFVEKDPEKTKFLLKMFINLLITMGGVNDQVAFETLDSFVQLILKSLVQEKFDLFNSQTTLFFNALTELEDSDKVLTHFTTKICDELINSQKYSMVFSLLDQNLNCIQTLKIESKINVINKMITIVENVTLDQQSFSRGLNLVVRLSKDLTEQNTQFIFTKFHELFFKYKSHEEKLHIIIQNAFNLSEKTGNVNAGIDLHYLVIENDLNEKSYSNALKRLDEAIVKIANAPNPRTIATKFIELIDRYVPLLIQQKQQEWIDLLSNKSHRLQSEFLGEGE